MSALFNVLSWVMVGLNLAAIVVVLVASVVGAVQVAITRDDAFMVIDRQKQNWLMLMGGAAVLSLVSVFLGIRMQMLWIIAAVIVGIYWQDVRPSIRDVLGNSSGSW